MRIVQSAIIASVVCLGLTGISRDGTLPARMSGISFPVPNDRQDSIPTEIRLFQTQPAPEIPFQCGLRGSDIEATSVGGELHVGDEAWGVIGTCFNPANNAVEIITDRGDASMQGRLSRARGTDLKGVIKLPGRTLKFELK